MWLTAENTAIVLDSSADLPDPEAEHPNWRAVPLTVRLDGAELRDGVDLVAAEFYRRLRASAATPTTAAPAPGTWEAALRGLDGYERVLVLPISARLSASHRSAEVAARALDPGGERIRVFDGRSASAGTLLLADGAQRLLEAGTAEDELERWLEAASARIHVLVYVDTLEYLVRGGRIGRARGMAGSVLGVHPLLTLEDGEVAPYRKVRGGARVRAEFERFLERSLDAAAPGHAAVAHADRPEEARALRGLIERVRPRVSVDRETVLGPVIGTYTGPGAYGFLVLREP